MHAGPFHAPPGHAIRRAGTEFALRFFATILAGLAILCGATNAAEPTIPNFWDLKERLPKPELDGVERLRFLTTVDFPPFNYLDPDGRLSGFHVDLARRICAELNILDKCQIQALPWNELDGALTAGDGEAIIAGIAITAENREKYVFSRPYLKFPARFIMPKASAAQEPLVKNLAEKRIGVLAASAHERMLRTLFPATKVVTYTRPEWMYEDLRDARIDGAFGDGMRFAFWLSGADSKGCCRFAGGPYLSDAYLGQGLAIAVRPDNAILADAFNYALREIQAKGEFAELYLRHFPLSFY